MRNRLAAALLAVGAIAPLAAQTVPPANAPTASYAALDRLPDWRGIWTPIGRPSIGATAPMLKGKYKPVFDETQRQIRAGEDLKSTRASNCAPPGMPGVMTQPYDIEFLFTPGRVTILQEAYMQVRRVFTDGRKPADDPDPTYNGYSLGHWEGDTLVIRTSAIRDDLQLGLGIGHSAKLVVTERIHLKPDNHDVLVDDLVFEDPDALAQPWHQTYSYQRHRDLDQLEFICADNDRNPIDANGNTGFVQPK